MFERMRGILEVIEYLDPTGQEIVHRVPEGGSGEIVLGSQLVVRENQVGVFFRDGRALDVLGPGRHTLTTLNIPFLVSYLKIPFGSKSPFRAEVVFVNLKDYLDQPWSSPQPIPFRDPDLGMVRLTTAGKFAFQVGQAQQFVNQVVGTQGLFGTKDIIGYLQSILNSRLTDVIGELHSSVLDLPTRYDELSAAVQAKSAVDFEALGLKIKAVFVTTINVPPEVEKAMDERASMGAIGNMQAYLQFKAARAIGDIAQNPGSGGSVAGLGVSLGAGAWAGRDHGRRHWRRFGWGQRVRSRGWRPASRRRAGGWRRECGTRWRVRAERPIYGADGDGAAANIPEHRRPCGRRDRLGQPARAAQFGHDHHGRVPHQPQQSYGPFPVAG